jgi:hypothetical protein
MPQVGPKCQQEVFGEIKHFQIQVLQALALPHAPATSVCDPHRLRSQ